MKENEQVRKDPHLDTPSEANREKHINFPEAEEGGSEQTAGSSDASDRRKEWKQGTEEGREAKKNAVQDKAGSALPMDNNDTLGVP